MLMQMRKDFSDYQLGGADKKAAEKHKLFLEYLCLSPTYELARKLRTKGRLSLQEQVQVPPDFDQVLWLYDLLGDVRRLHVAELLRLGNGEVFGDLWGQPHVIDVAYIPSKMDLSLEPHLKFRQNAEIMLNATRKREGLPPALLLHVPLNISEGQVIKQVLEALKMYGKSNYPQHTEKVVPKIQFAGQRFRTDALINGLRLMRAKALCPELDQWQLGVKVNLSKTHSEKASKNMGRFTKTEDERISRNVLYRITYRALKKAEYTAENAARGRFPVDAKIEGLKFDYKKIRRMTLLRILAVIDHYSVTFEPDEFVPDDFRPMVEDFSYIQWDKWLF